jgi:transcriptional regulator with XRE-family HTH domain
VSTYTVPQFEVHHRLQLALEAAGVEPIEMAEVLGLAKNTIYSYMSGARNPKLGMVKQWAMVCQVPWQWIITGQLPEEGDEATISAITQRYEAGNSGDNLRFLKLAA